MRLSSISNIFKRSSKAVSSPKAFSPRTGAAERFPATGAENLAVVYRCVRLLSESVAQLTLDYKKKQGSVFEAVTDSRLWRLLNVEFSPWLSAFDGKVRIVAHLLLHGDAYVIPIYGPDGIVRLAVPRPWLVSHDVDCDTYTVNDLEEAVKGTFSEADIIHVSNYQQGSRGKGMSVLGYMRRTLAIATSAEDVAFDNFAHNGVPRGIISSDRQVPGVGKNATQQIKFVAADIEEEMNGGRRIVALPGSNVWQGFAMSMADMQLLQMRTFQVREICRFFGVHPSFVFDDTSNNYKSAEMANVAFLSNTLNPLLRKIENEFSRKLIPIEYAPWRKIEFNRQDLYATDLESRMAYFTKLQATGMATVNELRSMIDLQPVEGGDTPLVSANLKTIQQVIDESNEGKKNE